MTTELVEGVCVSKLAKGSFIDLGTKSRHYQIECLGGDLVRVSGHPKWCPTPVEAKFEGSIGNSSIEPGFATTGLRAVFRRLHDRLPVTTSEITDIHLECPNPLHQVVDGFRRFLARH